MTLFRLVRFPNLVIVALTQYLLNYQIIQKALAQKGLSPVLDLTHFSLFVLVTLLITAGGYIINDITDLKADLVNKPEKVIIHKKVSIQTAFWLYFFLNLLGFILALLLAYHVKKVYLANLYPMAAMGLYAYSLKLKKTPFWGNFLVAAYCAGVAGLIWLAEKDAIVLLMEKDPILASGIGRYIIFYINFAFLTTLFREIIKDLEDQEGDRKMGYRTLPLVWGQEKTKKIAVWIGVFTVVLMVGFLFLFQQAYWFFLGMFTLVILLLGYTVLLLHQKEKKSDFKRISLLIKLVMLGGVLLLFLIKI